MDTFRSHHSGIVSALSLRRHASDHPMGFFSLAAAATLLSFAVSLHGAPQEAAGGMERGAPVTESADPVSLACDGQAWGNEDSACLLAIAGDHKKDRLARIRTISGA